MSYEWLALPPSFPPLPFDTANSVLDKANGVHKAKVSFADVLPCLIWVLASNGLIVLNKHLLSAEGFRCKACACMHVKHKLSLCSGRVSSAVTPVTPSRTAAYDVRRIRSHVRACSGCWSLPQASDGTLILGNGCVLAAELCRVRLGHCESAQPRLPSLLRHALPAGWRLHGADVLPW